MTRDLLIRGMLAGVVAAMLMMLFAHAFGEPQVDLSIAYETRAHAMAGMPEEPEVVSRAVQKGLGLITALTLYGAAVGGIFSLVFAIAYGRITTIGPRPLALLLALGAFIAIAMVPTLKYPPNPPAVGHHDTVAFRTETYFAMIALSLVAMVLAVKIGRVLSVRMGAFNAMLNGAGAYIIMVAAVLVVLPVIDEVPADFPAVVLWNFRLAALGIQTTLWLTIGLAFGAMAERRLYHESGDRTVPDIR